MATALRACIDTLAYLELTVFVTCDIGRVTIEVTQWGDLSVDEDEGRLIFKKSEVERLLGYLGEITGIMTLNHETDEEAVLF